MLQACNDATPRLNTGDVVRVVVRKTAVFGLFCEFGTDEILVLIPEISWIPSFASCEQVAGVGDEFEVKIVHIDKDRHKIAGSVRALHPASDPWHGAWRLGDGDVLEATVVRWVEKADRCGGAGAYLLALRPAALVMLCGQEAGRYKSGDRVAVRVTAIDARQGKVTVALVQ
jgi:ribosomal protein S1